MRMHRAFSIGIPIVALVLVLLSSVPASAATRLRVYRGPTSQEQSVAFRVVRTDQGRFIAEFRINVTLVCQDETTQDWGIGFGFGRRGIPITDGMFSFDSVDPFMALHIAGRLGSLAGEGTLSVAVAALTGDEQAQLCTTGDLTWSAEYDRTIIRPVPAAETTVRLAPADAPAA